MEVAVRRLQSAALAGALVLSASCAPPASPAGSGDGGVPVSNPNSGAAAAPAPVDVVLSDTAGLAAPMTLYPFDDHAPAGDVTFRVKNVGTVEHELIVLKTDTPFDQLPIADSGDPPAPVATAADKVDEANNVAETGDPNLRPGDLRTFTAKGLVPGRYILVCNLAKHYGLGMRAAFTVTTAGTSATPAPVSNVTVSLKDTTGLNGPMSITPSATVGSAGNITFTAKNDGTIDHELLVIKTDGPFDQIPIVDSGDPPAPVKTGADKIDEANNIAETGDPNLKPGESRTFGAKGLAPGHYVLVCNLAKHYGLGMRAAFTVVPPPTTPPSAIKASLNDTAGLNGRMSITLDSAFGKAGNIAFTAVNNGTVDHELLVIKTDAAYDQIPIADAGDPPAPVKTGADKIDEANNIAETGDPNLKPGESRTFTASGLAPGNYVLVCNLAQHYGLGMRVAFTVS
jgi:uncharacterized cupredoxin-like copper-binding protein